MSRTQPSPEETGDTDLKRTDGEVITDVRDLEVDDVILVGGRSKPITVERVGVRTQPLADGDPDQHFVYARGEWSGANRVELHNEIHISGRRTGTIVDSDGRDRTVRRVER